MYVCPFNTCTHDLITDCIAIWFIIQSTPIDIKWVLFTLLREQYF